ncbi:Mig-14 family protein [Cronobacter dublinensis]
MPEMLLKPSLAGWEPSDFHIYKETYRQYGGSVNTHPDAVEFFMQHKDMRFTFWHFFNVALNKITAAYFTVNDQDFDLNVWREYPLSYDEVMMPIAENARVLLPIKTNRLSLRHRNSVLNSSFLFRTKRKVCLVKDQFSTKTIKKRNSELRKFLASGGESHQLSALEVGDIADFYIYLFNKRFSDTVRCYGKLNLIEMLTPLKHMIAGSLFFYKGAPCAIDMVLKAESDNLIYFDVPNGGLDPVFNPLSPGSLLMWNNINEARSLCHSGNKAMIFCIGLYDKNWDYKLRWANAQRTGKTLVI